MDVLNIDHCSRSFKGRVILDNLALTCSKGEIVGILGRNGCGKSTLLKIIFGTLKAGNIQLVLDGEEIGPKRVISKRLIGYIPQERFLPGELKVRDVIPLYFYSSEDQNRVFYAPGIPEISDQKVRNLSIGQQKYLEVLLVGNLDHSFLMLDEPFSMMDPLYVEKLMEFIHSLKQTKGLLITDHYYEDVCKIADRILVLRDGKLTPISTREELSSLGYLRS